MSKQRIGILFGGKSGEHEVSLVSAASVYEHLDSSRFQPFLIGIDYDGRWYLQQNPKVDPQTKRLVLQKSDSTLVKVSPGEGLFLDSEPLQLDAVFPVLHGTFGEDGTVQGLLEIAHLPYVGAGVLGSSLGMDKAMVKRVWMQDGLNTNPFVQAERHEFDAEGGFQQILDRALAEFEFPLFIKPARSGSSVGVSRAADEQELFAALETAFQFDTKLLIEPEVEGREVECSVVGNENPEAFAVGEIVPSHEFYDYEAKYLDPDGADLRIPAPLDQATTRKVQELAVKAYRSADTEGFARMDFFLREDGEIILNEINTIPGFTSISMFPKLCEHAGLVYSDLITTLIHLGIERFKRRESLHYSRE